MFRADSEQTRRDLSRVDTNFQAAVRQVLGQLAQLAAYTARSTDSFTDRTGKLRNSVKVGQKSIWAHFVKASAPYAGWVEDGTQPHVIRARRKPFLVFEAGGRLHFRKRVLHPGTKPARFMAAGRNAAEAVALRFVETATNSAINS